jgi:hypothetical protein
MPGSIRKSGRSYRVLWGGKVRAKNTTKTKAMKQLRLLRAVEHGWKPTRKRR